MDLFQKEKLSSDLFAKIKVMWEKISNIRINDTITQSTKTGVRAKDNQTGFSSYLLRYKKCHKSFICKEKQEDVNIYSFLC